MIVKLMVVNPHLMMNVREGRDMCWCEGKDEIRQTIMF